MRSWLAVATLVLTAACDFGTLEDLATEEASQGSEELTRQALQLFRVASRGKDTDVAAAISDVDGVVSRGGNLPIQVRIGDLTDDDLSIVGFAGRDAAGPQGMLIVTELDCSLDQVARLSVAKNQTALYPGLYDRYARAYTSSAGDFFSGAVQTVGWRTDYTASLLSRTYSSTLTGFARRVERATRGGAPVVIVRTILDRPATFIKGGEDAAFEQDYQVELFYEVAPAKVRHFYALWRQFHMGAITSEMNLYVNLVLGNLVDFDVRTGKICRDGAPQPTFE